MRTHHIAPYDQLEPRNGVLVVDGWGIRIHVHAGHLIVEDGVGRTRRTRPFNRATHGLRRLALLGHTGYLTLEAIRWLAGTGIALLHVDQDGQVLDTSARMSSDQPALRRAQALAATRPAGLEITRWILHHKITGQARVAADIAGPDAGTAVAAWLRQLDTAQTLDEARLAEALAANTYFDVWAQVPVRFPTADRQRVPDHWTRVGPRRSPITGKSQTAANPAQAMLNYLYALLEAEARIACFAIGLDPGIGILHSDANHRDSLALDIIEAVRPVVDAYLLHLLRAHVFRASDFHETRQGACRVLAPLTHELAATTVTWAERLAPIAEEVVRQLAEAAGGSIRTSTRLTQAKLRAGVRRRENSSPVTRTRRPPGPAPHCQECGNPVEPPHRRCQGCHSEYLADPDNPRLSQLALLRAQGRDPAHGGDTGRQRGRTNARHVQRAIDWEQEHPRPDPEEFRRNILPGLQHCSPQKLADATGLSYPYCALIRKGERVPHPRHWNTLSNLT
ncbi:MAG: CRISPR-associated endonuclease Cas1 [Acidimicrobiia bacterium]|nr:CRISPR-associated endonuclease Cas1 [Acidimicrobiia bacterium]